MCHRNSRAARMEGSLFSRAPSHPPRMPALHVRCPSHPPPSQNPPRTLYIRSRDSLVMYRLHNVKKVVYFSFRRADFPLFSRQPQHLAQLSSTSLSRPKLNLLRDFPLLHIQYLLRPRVQRSLEASTGLSSMPRNTFLARRPIQTSL